MNSVDETKFPTKILSKADKEIKLPLVLETQMMKSFGFFARYYGIVYFVMLCFFSFHFPVVQVERGGGNEKTQNSLLKKCGYISYLCGQM